MPKSAFGLDDLSTGTQAIEQTFGNEDESAEQKEEIAEQQKQLAELLPSVQNIIDTCDAEIEAVADMRAYMKSLGADPKENVIKDEYRARELYIGFLERLKNTIAEQVPDGGEL